MPLTVSRGETRQQELEDDGFKQVQESTITWQGQQTKKVTYRKGEDETFGGKIPTMVASGFLGIVASVLTLGLANLSEKFRKATWGNVKTTYDDEKIPLVGKKLARLTAGILGVLASGGLALASSEFRKQTFGHIIQGHQEEDVYFASDKEELTEERIETLGYNPRKKETIAAFLDKLRLKKDPRLHVIQGNIVFKEDRREGDGVCSFLMMPVTSSPEDIKNGKGARSISYWSANTGGLITSHDEQDAIIQCVIASRSFLKKDWVKQCTDYMTSKYEKEHADKTPEQRQELLNSNAFKEDVKKMVKSRSITVLNLKDHNARFFVGDVDPNETNIGSFLTGMSSSTFDDSLKKKCETILNRNLMESKKKLEGDKMPEHPDSNELDDNEDRGGPPQFPQNMFNQNQQNPNNFDNFDTENIDMNDD